MKVLVRCLRAKDESDFEEGFQKLDKFISVVGAVTIFLFVFYLGVHGVFYLLK